MWLVMEHYAERANRDARYKELKAQYPGHEIIRSTSRNQELHPMYVEDRKQGLSDADKGFGNTIYRTRFSTLYNVEVR